MNVQGNFESLDGLGNFARDIFGEPMNASVVGLPPLDVWGYPAGTEVGSEAVGDIAGEVINGLLDFVW